MINYSPTTIYCKTRVRQRPVVEGFPGLIEGHRMVIALAHIEPAVHVVLRHQPPPHDRRTPITVEHRKPTASLRGARAAHVPNPRSTGSTETGDNTPRSCTRQGQ